MKSTQINTKSTQTQRKMNRKSTNSV